MTGMCPQKTLEQVQAYHDGELSVADRAAVEAHLAGCADCTAELARLRALSGMLRGGAPVMSAEAMRRLLDQVHYVEEETIVLPLVRRLTGLAAAVLLAGSLWLGAEQMHRRTPVNVNPTYAQATTGQANSYATAALTPAPELPEGWEHTAVTLNTEPSVDVQLADWIIEPSGNGGGNR